MLYSTTVLPPTVEHLPDGFAIGCSAPRLSWRLETTDPLWQATAYEIELTREGAAPESVKVESSEQVLVPWPFHELASRERAAVRVRVFAADGTATQYSAATTLEVGLLNSSDWSAQFISAPAGADDTAPILFRDIELDDVPSHARVYVTALGLYELTINGQRVGSDILTPGWTAYEHRLRFQTYDIGHLLRRGTNRIEALLGNGWYRGQLVSPGNRNLYGDRLALCLQLEATMAHGEVHTTVSDESWNSRESRLIFNDIYDGETRDLRNELDAPAPRAGVELLGYEGRLVSPEGPAMRVTERRPVAAVIASPNGSRILDFGQNVVGWVRVTNARGPAGSTVTVRHAEVLEGGELGTRPLRSAKATCTYILSGGSDTLEPCFTFHGFRYAEISGLDIDEVQIEAVVIGTDLRRTGWLKTSNPEVNRLVENIVWSTRGNFLDVPMDCPQRDERLGWTGDIQVFAPAAVTLFDTAGFLSSWLRDLAAEQFDDGGMPYVIPDVLRGMIPGDAAAGWGDAATLVPWAVYEQSADLELLRRQYPSMKAWVDKVDSVAGPEHLWGQGYQFGDWLDPGAPPEDAGQAKADPAVVATAYFFRSASVLARAAHRIGNMADASKYKELRERVRDAFLREYVSDDGVVRSDCQTVYALALAWDIIADHALRHRLGVRLEQLVREAGYCVSTGFLGTPVILEALTRSGHSDAAVRMLLNRERPSWLYAVSLGATTIWERWDSMLPDGSINPGAMTSFNHFAYGAIADWMFRRLAGVTALSVGYREVQIEPMVTDHLNSVEARVDTAYGRIVAGWSVIDGTMRVSATIPAGTSGRILLPDGSEHHVSHGTHRFVSELSRATRSAE